MLDVYATVAFVSQTAVKCHHSLNDNIMYKYVR